MKTAFELALAEIGTVEWAKGSNPKVVAYYRDAGHPEIIDDSVAWCAAFVGAMLHRAGIKPSGKLTALSYLDWGQEIALRDIAEGDIGIKRRGNSIWEGHVFFIEKVANGKVYALGGNQRDAVNIQTYPISSLIGVRRASTGKPASLPTPKQGIKPASSATKIGKPADLRPVSQKTPAAAIGAVIVAIIAAVLKWLGVW